MSVATKQSWAGETELQRLGVLYRLLAALTRADQIQDVYDAAIEGLLEATQADRAAILLYDDDNVMGFKAWRGLSTAYRDAVTGHTPWQRGARGAEPIAVPDVLLDESLRGYQKVFAAESIRAVVFVPLALDTGVFGKFMLYYADPHECEADELAIAQAIAGHVAISVDRASLLAREQEARRTAEQLNGVAPKLLAELDPRRLVQEVIDTATALVGAECGAFLQGASPYCDSSERRFAFAGEAQLRFADLPQYIDLLSPTFLGEPAIRCDDLTQDPRFRESATSLPVRSYLAVPLVSRHSEILGGLYFGHSKPGMFQANHESIVKGIAGQTVIAMENARLFEQAGWAQAELQRSNAELRRVNQDLEVFAYSASHDLQEPLRTISISAQLLERNRAAGRMDDAQMFLSRIVTSTERMGALVQDLLAYMRATKAAEGQLPRVEVAAALRAAQESMKATIEKRGAQITSGDLPAVDIHENRLVQLLQNLIGNAIKYCSQEIPHVHISADRQDGWTIISVTDNGIGIEPEYSQQIFGLFKRLHTQTEYPGSGIGLAICQRISEQYGGKIWLERSSLGDGSTFSFAIPTRNG